jgi:xanthine/CO dehydrogenase XdhC/CoxF family maturation factor
MVFAQEARHLRRRGTSLCLAIHSYRFMARGRAKRDGQLMGDSEDILQTAVQWRRAGRGVALATVVSTWGSSPRPVGSKLAIDSGGAMSGSVSGGCVEGAVVEAALEIIRTGHPRLLEFGVSDERAWEVGLACGGRVQIFVERLS